MANFFSELAEFVWTVLSHWQAYMTGGIIMAALFIYERFWQKTVSTRTVLVGIAAFLLVAFFMAWRDQSRLVKKTQIQLEAANKENAPQLVPRINFISVGPNEEGQVGIVLVVSVRNVGMPSIATGWRCLVRLKDRSEPLPTMNMALIKPIKLTFEGNPKVYTFSPEDALYNKGAQPIAKGAEIVGTLLFRVPGIDINQIRATSGTATLIVEDILGKEYETTKDLPSGVPDEGPMYYPGMKSVPVGKEPKGKRH